MGLFQGGLSVMSRAMMVMRRYVLVVVTALCALTGVLAFPGASALAAVTHDYLSQITEVPAGSGAPLTGQLSDVSAMTVDAGALSGSGALYLSEHISGTSNSYRTDVFNASSGAFASQLAQTPPSVTSLRGGVAVGHLTGEEVYVGAVEEVAHERHGVVAAFDASTGAFQGTWGGEDTPSKGFGNGEVRGVAVDNSKSLSDWAANDVYVADAAKKVVDVFEPQAGGKEKYVTQITGISPSEPFIAPVPVAVDEANGDVLIVDYINDELSVVDVFEPASEMPGVYNFVRKISGPPSGSFRSINGVAVDGGDGHIFVVEQKVVYEFGSESAYLARIAGTETPAGTFGRAASLAVDSTTHEVYVGDAGVEGHAGAVLTKPAVDVFAPDTVVPDIKSEPVSNLSAEGATLNGTVDPDGEGEASCEFVASGGKASGEAKCSESVPNGVSAVPVHTTLSGLTPDTSYCYRLEASNANGVNRGEEAEGQVCFSTPGPGMHGESVSAVSAESATLNATIDPDGASTTYYFQYGKTSAYEEGDVPILSASAPDGALLGSGQGDVEVGQHVQGLQAGAVYHYRVVAVSELGGQLESFAEPDHTFTTQLHAGALTLPDGRAWELVSPPDKHGASVFGINSRVVSSRLIQASADGESITFPAFLPTEAEPQGYGGPAQILSERGSDGWSSRDIATPHESASAPEGHPQYQFFSEDLSLGLVNPQVGFDDTLLSSRASEPTPYLRRQSLCEAQANTAEVVASECYLPLVTAKEGYADVPLGTKFAGPEFTEPHQRLEIEGATADAGHVLLHSAAALTTPTDVEGVYEWSAGKPASEELELVSLLPANEGGGPAPAAGSGLEIGSALWSDGPATRHAISNDGTRVFWARGKNSQGEKLLYVRDTVKKETLRLDVQQPGAPAGEVPEAQFQIASGDGATVFFTDTQRLTAQSGSGNDVGDLYKCEIAEAAGKLTCKLSDLTPASKGEPAEVQKMVLGASEDGSYVYFVASGVLANGATPPGHSRCGREASVETVGAICNLYVNHDGTTTFIATLSSEDETDWDNSNVFFHNVGQLTAKVSPDGRYLAFMSDRSLTGYDNRDVNSGRPDEEVYLYDASDEHLVCASCDPTGARPIGVSEDQATALSNDNLAAITDLGSAGYGPGTWLAANIPTGTELGSYGESLYQSRYLSDSGRLFFNSSDALVPQDINGQEDVYEYESPGVGDCTASSPTFGGASGGCVSLISSGLASGESGFLDASESGDDVFFITGEKLVSQDYDSALDVYDAHVCTTREPCTSSPALPPECTTADACRVAPLPQPSIFGAPASATFTGTGNIGQSASESATKPGPTSKAKKTSKARKKHKKKRGKRSRKANAKRRAKR
jgi:hypothetical protein